MKTAPGISPTSPAGSNVLVSALGSGVDQNQFLIDGTNVTATGNGVARADPGIDFIQELQIQSVGASVEYGNVQGAVVNVITKSGGDRFLSDTSYYSQFAALTSQPAAAPVQGAVETGYERDKYRDFTSSSAVLSFAIGCGSSPDTSASVITTVSRAPIRTFRGNTNRTRSSRSSRRAWRQAGSWSRAFTSSSGRTPRRRRRPSRAMRPRQLDASVPAMNLGHLTHTVSSSTVWDVRVGRFNFTQDTSPTSGDPTIPNRIDLPENVWSGGPQQIGKVQQVRTTVKAT